MTVSEVTLPVPAPSTTVAGLGMGMGIPKGMGMGMGMSMGALSNLGGYMTLGLGKQIKPSVVKVGEGEVILSKDGGIKYFFLAWRAANIVPSAATWFFGEDGKPSRLGGMDWPAAPEETSMFICASSRNCVLRSL